MSNRSNGKRKSDSSGSESGDVNKKPCFEGAGKSTSFLWASVIEGDLGDAIAGFLDIEELASFARTSKKLMRKLKYEHVIRSGMTRGHGKMTIERIVESIDKIYVPSPFRLLQLVMANHCEKCNYNLVYHPFAEFGMSVCSKRGRENSCVDEMLINLGSFKKMPEFLSGVAKYCQENRNGARLFMWKRPCQDSYGNPFGPLICYQDIEQVGKDYGAIQALMSERKAADPYRDQVPAIQDAFQVGLTMYNIRREEKKIYKELYREMKKLSTTNKIQDIVAYVGSCIDDKYAWKSVAMEHTCGEYYYYRGRQGDIPYVKFRMRVMNEMLSEFIDDPRGKGARKKLLRETANRIIALFEEVYRKGYHELAFLANDTFERGLRAQILRSNDLSRLLDVSTAILAEIKKTPQQDASYIETSFLLFNLARPHHYIAAIAFSLVVHHSQVESLFQLVKGLWKSSECLPLDARARYKCCCKMLPSLFSNAQHFIATAAAQNGFSFVRGDNGMLARDWTTIELLAVQNYNYAAVMERIWERAFRLPHRAGA